MHKYYRYAILQIILFVTLIPNSLAGNLINNAGFENGITGWSKNMNNGSIASFTTDTLNSPEGNRHFKCVVSKPGVNDWDIQIRSNAFAVDQSHNYRLTFKAKGSKSGSQLKVYIQKNAWMGKTFTLTDSWATYTYEFFPNESMKELKFNFVEIAEYYIDDIVLEDISVVNTDFNTPPSCVITAPHVNAYFKEGSNIAINAFSTDIGGSGLPGKIQRVEFFVDGQKIGESDDTENNTYTLNWIADNVGEYIISAVASDTSGKSFRSAGVIITVGTKDAEPIGLSSGKGKYLGNVARNEGIEPTFLDYWNAVTSGNGGKWQTVERTRNVMNWNLADQAYNLAKKYNLPYRYHTLAWGSQYPDWIKYLSPAAFQEEMEQFIKAISDRYPYIDQIDVINEALPGHQEDTKYFINGLGGTGESGYDWAVWLFKKAREYFPNAKLILNDFAMVNSSSNIRQQMLLLKVLRDSALVDGFGAQAHTFNLDQMNPADLKKNLDLMATAGVPIYITEMDMEGVNTTEASQLENYQKLFPVLWEHPDVAGITLWGYVQGEMWRPNAGLINKNGTERSSMVWLKSYFSEQENVGFPFTNHPVTTISDVEDFDDIIRVYPNPSIGKVSFYNGSNSTRHFIVFNIYGRKVDAFFVHSMTTEQRNLPTGIYVVRIGYDKTVKLLVE